MSLNRNATECWERHGCHSKSPDKIKACFQFLTFVFVSTSSDTISVKLLIWLRSSFPKAEHLLKEPQCVPIILSYLWPCTGWFFKSICLWSLPEQLNALLLLKNTPLQILKEAFSTAATNNTHPRCRRGFSFCSHWCANSDIIPKCKFSLTVRYWSNCLQRAPD